MFIRPLTDADTAEWVRMRLGLWPELSTQELQTEMQIIRADSSQVVFVAERPQGGLGAFVEVSLHREYVPGCDTSPVGYIEGWYVDADLRRQGLGGQLFATAEDWARRQGCQEMGSDCELKNDTSFRAHLALGYQEAERLIHFFKRL